MGIKYRLGEKKDCAKLAELINMASDGVVEYLCRDLIPGMTSVQVVAYGLENGYNVLSLIVFADNTLAMPFYKRTGFKVVQKVELGGNEFINHEDDCLLMKCEIGM